MLASGSRRVYTASAASGGLVLDLGFLLGEEEVACVRLVELAMRVLGKPRFLGLYAEWFCLWPITSSSSFSFSFSRSVRGLSEKNRSEEKTGLKVGLQLVFSLCRLKWANIGFFLWY